MKLFLLSLFLAITTICLLFVPTARLIHNASVGNGDQTMQRLTNDRWVRLSLDLLYWPDSLISWISPLGCANADQISEKLTCVLLALSVDLVAYSSLWFVVLRLARVSASTRRLRNLSHDDRA